ncbi:hypothetical protein BH688_03740 [Kushneria phosphatilytica]|nr:hypothetical protein BH688_03740 [Kushneria phosphatilytica]
MIEPGYPYRRDICKGLRPLFCSVMAALLLVLSGLAQADGPALSQSTVDRLQQLQQQLSSGQTARVLKESRASARGLSRQGAEGWAKALYLQLAASAARRAEQPGEAAELLSQARAIEVAPYASRLKWLEQEAALRARAGEFDESARLYHRWASQASLPAKALWSAAQVDAHRGAWKEASDWLGQARSATSALNDEQRQLALTIYQHAGNDAAAAAMIELQLDGQDTDAEDWRQAAALYQRSGEPGRAAAVWEAGWQRGLLKGSDDLLQRIRLHMAGGTPARAGEILAAALKDGRLENTAANQRLLAQAWTQARARDRALAAWQGLAEHTDSAAAWQELGELAYGWGRWQHTVEALTRALQRSADHPGRLWLLKGVAAYELGDARQAREAFQQAARHEESSDQAEKWLKTLGESDDGPSLAKPEASAVTDARGG